MAARRGVSRRVVKRGGGRASKADLAPVLTLSARPRETERETKRESESTPCAILGGAARVTRAAPRAADRRAYSCAVPPRPLTHSIQAASPLQTACRRSAMASERRRPAAAAADAAPPRPAAAAAAAAEPPPPKPPPLRIARFEGVRWCGRGLEPGGRATARARRRAALLFSALPSPPPPAALAVPRASRLGAEPATTPSLNPRLTWPRPPPTLRRPGATPTTARRPASGGARHCPP